jgi:2-C-methyl-D-erythritol 4-phosphate cytidylyltransferase
MGETGGKIFAEIGGKEQIPKAVLSYSLEAFQKAGSVDEIVVVAQKEQIDKVCGLCKDIPKVIGVVAGGADRAASVLKGLERITAADGIVVIHDGARPLAVPALIDRVVSAAKEYRAAIPAVLVKDTVKEVKNGFVRSTPDRKSLYSAQTPQAFDLRLYREAAGKPGGDITDDSMLVERLGIEVRIVEGSYLNIKITTPEDLLTAQALLALYN